MKNVKCSGCGEDINPAWRVCAFCGVNTQSATDTSTSNRCSSCQAEIDPHWALCPYCGAALKEGAGQTRMQAAREEAVIVAEDLTKTYKMGNTVVNALNGVNVSINRGEIVSIMGTSGSGKSTMLNQLGALDTPTSGKVFIDGKNIGKMSDKKRTDLRRHKIGFIFQFFNLIPILSARENVELPMKLLGIGAHKRKKRAMQLLDLVGLADRAKHMPDELSGGQQQRVAIARSLANQPEIIFADEATGDLDSNTSKEVMTVMKEICKQTNATLVIVTHDPAIGNMAERILHMKDGLIIGEERLN